MALSRLNEFNDGTALTETKQEGEFDNIYNNALTLISPLTGNLDADGNQIISHVIESATSNPGSELNEGRLFYRSDINQPIFYDGADFTGTAPDVRVLTNQSGGTAAVGAVVVIDSANASSFTTTTTEGNTFLPCVVLESTNNTSKGLVCVGGFVTTLNVTGSTAIRDYLKTSTTGGKAVPTTTFETGVFAIALTTSSTAVSAFIFGPNTVTAIDTTTNLQNLIKNGGMEHWSVGTSSAPDGWTLTGASATVAREGTTFKLGTYSAAVTRAGTDLTLSQDVSGIHPDFQLNYFDSRVVTFGAWVSASVSSTTRLAISDGVGTGTSSFHDGDNTFQFLTVTRTIDSSATDVTPELQINTSNTTSYIDGAILVQGSNSPAFSPHPSDTIVPTIDPQGTPNANQLYKSNFVKGWIEFDGTGTIATNDSFNVSGVVDNGTGLYTISWDRDFSDANYAVAAMSAQDGGDGGNVSIISKAAGTMQINTTGTDANTDVDLDLICLIAIGAH
ncbi:hypothetical protein LCGC14_0337960 [marine sediment metagenome]|uniref:Uncharacterized protein n=1 Tax=marine sediment metagenome TaxID=412755 RepID=A0A0F9TXB1_9ZZZZ